MQLVFKDIIVKNCDTKDNCESSSVSHEMMEILNGCNFEGSLLNDARSIVHVSRCVGDLGTVDVSIMSAKVLLNNLKISYCICMYRLICQRIHLELIQKEMFQFLI